MHCKERKKSVDHLATQCGNMLHYDYTFRHNEVIRCIHLHLTRKFHFYNIKRLKAYKVSGVMENEHAKIIIDTPIKTDIHVDHNKLDMVVFDKRKGEILFIEVGVTNQNILQSVELEKYRKYDILAKEYSRINKMPVRVVPYVLSWDGVVTKLHKKYRRELGIDRNIHCYIQSLVLKKTFESISIDFRRYQGHKSKREQELGLVVKQLYDECDVVKEEETGEVNKP